MMGLGYLGSSSSSSSSSNLSPLAPPFTVDRSNHNKPALNSNSISHFNDPSYGVPFTSSWHSSTGRQDFLADSGRTTTLPLNDSRYMIPEPVNLPTAGNWSGLNSNGKHGLEQITPGRPHWSAVYPSPTKRVADSFSYNLSEAKPFYPPYASSSSVNNDDIPLVTFSEPGYDLLSSSGIGLAHGHGDETSQVDYTRSLSGLEYNPQQDSVWSTGLPEGKQVKKIERDDSFFSEEANLAAYNNYFNQGAYGNKSSSKSKDDPSLFYYADIIRRANNSGHGKSDAASFSANATNHSLDPNDLSKGGSTFRAFPMFSESHPLIQSPEPPEDLWNSQNSYNPNPYEKRYHMFDDHTTKSSALVIKPPAPAVSSKGLEIGNLSALNINDVLKEKEQSLSGGSFLAPNQLSFQIGRPSSTTKEDMSASDQLKFEFKAQVPDINTTGNVKISANSFEQFDHHNPAEDSPCWKGAPASQSQFLPFESQSPQPPMKKLQTGNGVDETNERKEDSVEVVVVNSSEPSNGGGVVDNNIKPKKESSKLKLPTPPEMDVILSPKNVNASGVVKSLYDLSDLLLLHCSNDEFALKEHDREALDRVIHNLGVCMSKATSPTQQQKTCTSNMSQEMRNETILHDDGFGKNVEKLLPEHASQDVDRPKDHKMVKAIQKVLAENVECEVKVTETLSLYKNLWLEAEAELCSLSFRSRFERLKTQTHKSTDAAASPIKKEITVIDDDVEAGVMARFNILKRREDPNPVADIIDPWVMDRLSILKLRGELNANNNDSLQVTDCVHDDEEEDEQEEEEEEAVGSGGSDWEHILKDDFSWRLS
ncbi:unnamed protein product [Lactuca saligna]|uniref:Uncharacterized protein n=1 Tax=Lactuca saligna TaxID=75948 RepID=A0AA36DWF3_LACSI|nr:unnamed protein product [Lactuca saligna]